ECCPAYRDHRVQPGDTRLHDRADRGAEPLYRAERPRDRLRQCLHRAHRGVPRAWRRLADTRRQRIRAAGGARRDAGANQLGRCAAARGAAAAAASGIAVVRGYRTQSANSAMVRRTVETQQFEIGRRSSATRSRQTRSLALLIAGVVIAAAGFGSVVSPAARAQGTAEPPKVVVVEPKTEAVTNYVELTGNAAAISSVNLVARVEGYLESQNFQDGAIVKKDELLFKIQQDQYKAQLIGAQAQVQAAKAGIEYARTEIIRYKALVKQEPAAQTEVDHWVYEKASADAKLLGAQAQVTLAQLNLGYTEVRAPYDGQMSKGQIYAGNLVGSPGQQSTALATIYQIDPIYVVANLS